MSGQVKASFAMRMRIGHAQRAGQAGGCATERYLLPSNLPYGVQCSLETSMSIVFWLAMVRMCSSIIFWVTLMMWSPFQYCEG